MFLDGGSNPTPPRWYGARIGGIGMRRRLWGRFRTCPHTTRRPPANGFGVHLDAVRG